MFLCVSASQIAIRIVIEYNFVVKHTVVVKFLGAEYRFEIRSLCYTHSTEKKNFSYIFLASHTVISFKKRFTSNLFQFICRKTI